MESDALRALIDAAVCRCTVVAQLDATHSCPNAGISHTVFAALQPHWDALVADRERLRAIDPAAIRDAALEEAAVRLETYWDDRDGMLFAASTIRAMKEKP